jgi:hypothetical protein
MPSNLPLAARRARPRCILDRLTIPKPDSLRTAGPHQRTPERPWRASSPSVDKRSGYAAVRGRPRPLSPASPSRPGDEPPPLDPYPLPLWDWTTLVKSVSHATGSGPRGRESARRRGVGA